MENQGASTARGSRRTEIALALTFALVAARSAWAQAPLGRVYVPISPCRIVDTRLPSPTPLVVNTTRTFHVVGSASNFTAQGGAAGGCGIPGFAGPLMPQAQAVMFNFIAVAAQGSGNFRAWASDSPMPLASTLNYAAVPGLNLANGIIVPVRQDVEGDDLSVRASVSGAHLVVDVVGYFTDFAQAQVVRSLNGQADTVTLNATNGLSAAAGAGTVTLTSNATSTNTAGAIVSRDGSGNFSAGTITGNLAAGMVALSGNLDLPNTSAGSVGVVTKGGTRFLHNFGLNNTFLGLAAGNLASTGGDNTAVGSSALFANTGGSANAAFGRGALGANMTGASNSAYGYFALSALTSGDNNIGIGALGGGNLSSGSLNIYIGNEGEFVESNTIHIGSSQTRAFMAGISGQASGSGVAVLVNDAGKLGTLMSSRRYKEGIADLAAESDLLMKLRPVAFYYKPEYDATRTRQYGLVAEEVAEVAPQLVVSDKDGAPQAVRYHFVNAMLLNEAQKQRARIQDLEARLARLETALAAGR